MTDTALFPARSDLREKLKAIRDSDHPASPWARNVVQIIDQIEKHGAPESGNMRALGFNVAMMERVAIGALNEEATVLTPDELVTIFNLGTHQ